MTLTGADFLVRMSTIAVAFVGWSAIAVTLCRASGNQHAHDPRAISGAHGAVRGGATGRALWRAPR